MWHVETHASAPSELRRIVETIVQIRHLEPKSPLRHIPNELLFVIFAMIDVTNAQRRTNETSALRSISSSCSLIM